MAVTIDELEKKKADLADHMNRIIATADAETHGVMTAEQQADFDAADESFKAVEKDIKNRRRAAELNAQLSEPAPRLVRPDGATTSSTQAPTQGRPAMSIVDPLPRNHWGWPTFSHFAKAVKNAAFGQVDERLRISNATASTYGSEAAQADGGFAIPPDFRGAIQKKVTGSDSLLSRTDQQTTSSNQITFPTDETTPWQTSGGIVVSWDQEAAAGTQSKPQLGENTVRAYKLRAIVPITEELLADASGLSNWLNSKVPDKMSFAVDNAIINGSGAGQPVGLLNAGCKVTVSKEGSQAANTVLPANILKMWGRCFGQWRTNAVWLINQDVEQQLQQFVLGGTTAATPVYVPPGGLSAAPYATLMGRPVIVTEACKALSTEGDIILTDLRQYLSVLKTGGTQQEVSIHLWFDQDLVAFKFTLRVGGQPWWNSAITRLNGSNTLSSIVTLQSR